MPEIQPKQAKQPEFPWKYASPEKAAEFRKSYPHLKEATDQEIESAASLASFSLGHPNNPWKSPKFKELVREHLEPKMPIPWKYASPEKAVRFNKLYPNIESTGQEIEDAAHAVYWKKENGFNGIDASWRNPKFTQLMKKHIEEERKKTQLKKSAGEFERSLLAQPKINEVPWKYASPEKAVRFNKLYPNLKATNQEVEDAAYAVYWKKENGFNDLDEAWKSPKFTQLMKKHIEEERKKI